MFLETIKTTFIGVGQGFILGIIGYILVKRGFLGKEGLTALSRLTLDIFLPLLILTRLLRDFSFQAYAVWWKLPLLSIAITLAGLAAGYVFSVFFRERRERIQFVNLIAFQNSGYLPLVLVASLLSGRALDTMLIYLFLFLLGFNLVMFSVGVYLLTCDKKCPFNYWRLFNPPVAVTLLGLALIYLGWQQFVPHALLKPLAAAGDCTVPLSMLVVGGNVAAIHFGKIRIKAMSLMVFVKLLFLPLAGITLVSLLQLPLALSFLIVLQLAMPPATNLSMIISQYEKDDVIISEGVFIGHLACLVTLPLILSLLAMVRGMP